MCLVVVVVRRYIDFLILLIPTPLVSFLQQHLFIFKMFFVLVPVHFCNLFNNFAQYKQTYGRLRTSHGSRLKGCT